MNGLASDQRRAGFERDGPLPATTQIIISTR
jgi:hypothetical protein